MKSKTFRLNFSNPSLRITFDNSPNTSKLSFPLSGPLTPFILRPSSVVMYTHANNSDSVCRVTKLFIMEIGDQIYSHLWKVESLKFPSRKFQDGSSILKETQRYILLFVVIGIMFSITKLMSGFFTFLSLYR